MKGGGEQIYALLSSMKRGGRQDRTHLAQCINFHGHMTSSFTVGYHNDILLSTAQHICPKYGEIQTGMYFFVYTGALVLWIMSVNNLIPVFQQYLRKYVTYKYV